MTEALDKYLQQLDDDYENYRDCVDQVDVQIAREDAVLLSLAKCPLCGCLMPDDGSPCGCEEEEDDIPF